MYIALLVVWQAIFNFHYIITRYCSSTVLDSFWLAQYDYYTRRSLNALLYGTKITALHLFLQPDLDGYRLIGTS